MTILTQSQVTTSHVSVDDFLTLANQLKATYPDRTRRVEKAVQFVLFRTIERGDAGRVYWVGSETTPDTTYSVSLESCSCRDWQVRGGPCGHQLAVTILQKLERLTADREQADLLDVDHPIALKLTPEAYDLLDALGEPCEMVAAPVVGTCQRVGPTSPTGRALYAEMGWDPDAA